MVRCLRFYGSISGDSRIVRRNIEGGKLALFISVHTFDVTVENLGATPEELQEAGDIALAESDRLVAELDRRYPAPEVA